MPMNMDWWQCLTWDGGKRANNKNGRITKIL